MRLYFGWVEQSVPEQSAPEGLNSQYLKFFVALTKYSYISITRDDLAFEWRMRGVEGYSMTQRQIAKSLNRNLERLPSGWEILTIDRIIRASS